MTVILREIHTDLLSRQLITKTKPDLDQDTRHSLSFSSLHFDIPGEFVWHCHLLDHEDHEMMRPFKVVRGRRHDDDDHEDEHENEHEHEHEHEHDD